MLNNRHKSELVNTLILNKEIQVVDVPAASKATVVKKLCEMGGIQTLKEETQDDQMTTILVRYETDLAREQALKLNGEQAGGCTLSVHMVPNDGSAGSNCPVVLDEPKDIADCLGKRFAFVSSNNASDPIFRELYEREERESVDFSTDQRMGYNSPLTEDELEYALSLAKKDSAPGADEVSYSMLRNLAPSGKALLLNLLNRAFKEGKFPEKWKEALIIPILKEGKQPTSPGSYRPIALTSCICKVFERMLNRRLVWYLESRGYVNRQQSGFRRGRSTIDCLAALSKEAHDAYRRKQYLFCVFFDLEKAYDTCWKKLIMKELHRFGLRGELPKLIEDFLSGRSFRVKVGGTKSDFYEQEMGVPQGGVLSCTLFSLAINTVLRVIKGCVPCSLYVDDMRISYAHSNPEICRERLQKVLDALHQWSLETGFRFSIDKTEWMVFHRTKLLPGTIELTLGGKKLKEVATKKFLGLIFDRMLTWKPHIDSLRGRCMKSLNVLQLICYRSEETDSRTLMRVYRALIRSKLDYGCQVYGTAPPTYLLKLDPVHSKGLRLSLGAYRTSPKESMYVEAGELDLKTRRELLQLQYYARLKQLPPDQMPVRLDDTSLDGEYVRPSKRPISLGYRVRQLQRSMNIDLPYIDILRESSLGPWERPKPVVCMELAVHIKASTSSEEYMQSFLRHKHSSDVELYTDGSKSALGVGAGVAVVSTENRTMQIRRKLHNSASIFTAELYAIKTALISIKTSRNVSCVVYTDSRSAVQAIKGHSTSKLVLDIEEVLLILYRRGIQVVFCWVPSHVGIEGNELADKAAKDAIDQARVQLQEIPVADVKSFIKKKVYEKWTAHWEEKTLGAKIREFCPTFKRTPVNFRLGRRDGWKITRLRIGHTRFTHAHLLAGEEGPWCVACDEPVTVKHILISCGNNARVRMKYYDHREVTFNDLLSKKEYIDKVLGFLKEVDLYKDI